MSVRFFYALSEPFASVSKGVAVRRREAENE
ncbi:30S ribosomal protein S7 [Blastopirellula marina DSM 3645]|uniref:30S ribosomal protein S7 n=1 Tax=Blastopirellula marina DSM 3645 TaxID=314230 RepID=A3ZLH4_9BACT|nr:30S ribosomal protein S7 [Blastopirellula marina DSM 3645]